jgi:hypothetical protein
VISLSLKRVMRSVRPGIKSEARWGQNKMITYLQLLYAVPGKTLDLCWLKADVNVRVIVLWTLFGLTLTALMLHLGFGPQMADAFAVAG